MITFTNHFKSEADSKFLDFVLNEMKKEMDNDVSGYYMLPSNQDETLQKIEEYKATNEVIKSGKLKNVVVIGIGGSSLGAKAILNMLKDKTNGINLMFLENGDPKELDRVTKNIKKDETIFIPISKSGGTVETISIFKFVINRVGLDINNSEDKKHIIVITDPNSPLSQFAQKNQIAEFNLPKSVGGRFSVLSAVGLVPLALVGVDVKELLSGAKKLKDEFFAGESETLLQKAYHYFKYANEKPINVLFTYSSDAKLMNDWYVQLWGESLGKIDMSGRNVGLTPIGLVGSTDQHSFLQLIVQGPKNKTVTFVKVKNFENDLEIPNMSFELLEKNDYINGHKFQTLLNAQCDATMQSVIDAGVSADLIELETICEFNIGYLIYYFELLTSAVGVMLQVNTYDQPGVEFGKKILEQKFKG
ncbi:MAG: glucose-6-phosphate isomerase [Campylobacterales bacterium]|nr:glucose-6-phosphate isomerase [Campylobacterales bacterium]